MRRDAHRTGRQPDQLGDAVEGPVRARAPRLRGQVVAGRRQGQRRRSVRRPGRVPGTAGPEAHRRVAGPASQRSQGPDEVERTVERVGSGGHRGGLRWFRNVSGHGPNGVSARRWYGLDDVRHPWVVASGALIALLATVAVPVPVGTRSPSSFDVPDTDLFASVEIAAAVRGTSMTINPDPGARSDGTLETGSTLLEPDQRTEPTQARPRAAQPTVTATQGRAVPVAQGPRRVVVRPRLLRRADGVRAQDDDRRWSASRTGRCRAAPS